MSRKPLVAIVGRPNVGKSTFFNKVTGRKISIVEDKPGVTRDRLYADAEWCGKSFTLIDTGGIELKSSDEMWRHIKKQADIAIETADVIVFFCDAKTGLTAADYDVAAMLRRSGKPIVLAVNKLDVYRQEVLFDFYELGLGTPVGISSEQAKGIGDLLDEVCAGFPQTEEEEESDRLRIAIVGKPNAGKSRLTNALLGYDRTIVSDVAGTTRDAVDTDFEADGKKYTIIDTAGIRRKRSVDEDVEYYSVLRAFAAIRRADVCLIVIDASVGITEQDVKIAGYVHEQGKPSVVVMNKWDKVEKDGNTIYEFEKKLKTDLSFMDYFRSVYISAKFGQRVNKLFGLCAEVFKNANKRITTGTLNEVVGEAVRSNEPPTRNGRRLKLYYAVQDGVCPPTFVFFVNDSELMHFSYKRYLENAVRASFGFEGTPIRLIVRQKSEEK
ncbi:MAG: ribosome biogenesis GTPase Der [Candidatus Borkfalkiaceae bacterium]|nr:ribosome biogenesis GTPase Der [Christensenellaceae bacterium]